MGSPPTRTAECGTERQSTTEARSGTEDARRWALQDARGDAVSQELDLEVEEEAGLAVREAQIREQLGLVGGPAKMDALNKTKKIAPRQLDVWHGPWN